MIEVKSKNECCGCGACISVCNHRAISWTSDSEGFFYPQVDKNKCIDCKLCDKVCPFINQYSTKINVSLAYFGKCKYEQIQINSASGGLFPVIAKAILSKQGFVFGASFNVNWQVEHVCISDENELWRLLRSKYVQSDNRRSYYLVKEKLSTGKQVLYTGTPCQCLSLRKYLKRDYNNLLIVDVVCHGVPSPMVWNKYLIEQSQKMNERVEAICDIKFKYKDEIKYHWMHPGFVLRWDSGNELKCYGNETSYENGFLSNLFVRPSCHKCKVRRLSSGSDLTIGDYWGCDKLYPEQIDRRGVSVLFGNTDKGRKFIQTVSDDVILKPIKMEEATIYNPRILYSSKPHKRRKEFYRNMSTYELDELVPRLLRITKGDRLVNSMMWVMRIVKNTLRKGLQKL